MKWANSSLKKYNIHTCPINEVLFSVNETLFPVTLISMIIAARKFSTETIGVFSENLSFLSHNAKLANEKTNKQTKQTFCTSH